MQRFKNLNRITRHHESKPLAFFGMLATPRGYVIRVQIARDTCVQQIRYFIRLLLARVTKTVHRCHSNGTWTYFWIHSTVQKRNTKIVEIGSHAGMNANNLNVYFRHFNTHRSIEESKRAHIFIFYFYQV